MESSGKFERLFLKLLEQDVSPGMTAGAGGAFGDGPSTHDITKYAEDDARVPKFLGAVQTRKGTAGKKKKKKKKEEDAEDVHKPVKPGILKKRLGELSCSKVRGAKGKLKDKGTHYAKALQRYLNYHC
jgi:hypothetical protein